MIADIEVRESAIQGRGLFAKRSFGKGEFLFQTRPGRLISLREAKRMPRKAWDHLDDLENGQVEVTTAPTRFINHSCAPNAAWRGRRAYALRAIRKGEELTTDYRIYCTSGWRMRCRCGSRGCAGVLIADFRLLPKRLQKRYLPFARESVRAATLATA